MRDILNFLKYHVAAQLFRIDFSIALEMNHAVTFAMPHNLLFPLIPCAGRHISQPFLDVFFFHDLRFFSHFFILLKNKSFHPPTSLIDNYNHYDILDSL